MMRVRSPKTEHIEGHEDRMVLIFAELAPFIESCWATAEPGIDPHVIRRYRGASTNLRTQLDRIIVRAGLTPWPKRFQNFRSTRRTELDDEYPSHLVDRWMGHGARIAREHYDQVTDAHLARATGGALQNALQNPVTLRGTTGNEQQPTPLSLDDSPQFPVVPSDQWAMRDSNPRHPRCKRGALTN